MKIPRVMRFVVAIGCLAILPRLASAQTLADSGDLSNATATNTPVPSDPGPIAVTYKRPTEKTLLRNYAFDAFGPYPIAGAGIGAGIDQANDSPPEWKQGANGYGKRFISDFGIAAVTTTTRYGLAKAFREDDMYYRCSCKGFFPRLSHAVVATFTAKRGEDGHRVFSFPSVIAPYVGATTAVYGWYPSRFGAKDAFRMGNYSLLGSVGGNIALEFIYSGPHSLLARMHLNNGHGAPVPDSKP
ncbi:MAG TPA: hypothetical protein VEW69_12105 [Alphaproteobacteria bacterium]|nr:hypothetical protein [Alphaproteobacteria bacterium]